MATRMNQLAEIFSIAEDEEEESGQFEGSFLRMRAPLLPSTSTSTSTDNNNSALRHRPATATAASDSYSDPFDDDDLEHQDQQQQQLQPHQQRILDRSGMFHQSRGRWGVERRLSSAPVGERRIGIGNHSGCGLCCFSCCCCRKVYQECGKDWFFRLAYKKTIVLFLLLFFSYALIVCFFGFIYLALSIFGSKAEVNPDGSTRTIAFCDMGK